VSGNDPQGAAVVVGDPVVPVLVSA
jgi:hypothetical protein